MLESDRCWLNRVRAWLKRLICFCLLSGAKNVTIITRDILADLGVVTGGGKKSKRVRKKFGRRKAKNVLDFSSPEFFPRPLFPAPCNCPWVCEDEPATKGPLKVHLFALEAQNPCFRNNEYWFGCPTYPRSSLHFSPASLNKWYHLDGCSDMVSAIQVSNWDPILA